MSKTNKTHRSIVIDDFISCDSLEIWDAEAYEIGIHNSLFGIKITTHEDTEVEILINKTELLRISMFLLKLLQP